jgi:hypothetical protein
MRNFYSHPVHFDVNLLLNFTFIHIVLYRTGLLCIDWMDGWMDVCVLL